MGLVLRSGFLRHRRAARGKQRENTFLSRIGCRFEDLVRSAGWLREFQQGDFQEGGSAIDICTHHGVYQDGLYGRRRRAAVPLLQKSAREYVGGAGPRFRCQVLGYCDIFIALF